MGKFRFRAAGVAVVVAAVFAICAGAQEPPVRPPKVPPADEHPPENGPAVPRLEQSPLELWLQPDKNGALVPVPVFAPDDDGELRQHVLSWSDIDRLLDRIADQQNPRVSCQRIAIHGAVNGSRANLEIELTFLASPQRWVRAPVGLSSAVINGFESSTGGFLDFDEKEGFSFWMPPGPVATVESEPKTPPMPDPLMNAEAGMPMMPALRPVERTLKINASVDVTANGEKRQLNVRIPRAPSSRLEVLVDAPDAQANLVGSEALVSVESAGTGQTRIIAEGVGGDLILLWGPKQISTPAAAPVLKAQGVIEFALGDQIQATARLTLQSLSEPFHVFTVKLPPGMRLASSESADYEIIAAPVAKPNDDAGTAETRQNVLVRLRQETIGPVTVRLEAASSLRGDTMDFVEIGGFEVVEAVEQAGRLSLIAGADASVSWVESANIVQSSEPGSAGEAEAIAAQFRYFAQPFSLLVKAAPQKTRIRVEPTYMIEVFSDHVKLTADLAYQIHGAKASVVRVDLQGWKFDSVGGDDVVNPAVKDDQLSPLEIPFQTAVSGEVTVRLTAQRIVEGAKGSLRIPLPSPVADFVVSAVLAVAPNDNIELRPLPDQIHGLLPEPPVPLEELEISRKATLFYRTRAGELQPVFAADYEVKAGEVTVAAEGEVRLLERQATVRQEFAYHFAYEPVDQLAIDVPRQAYERGELRLLFDEAPIVPKAEEELSRDRTRLQLAPAMTLGRRLLTVEYSHPLPEISPQQSISYTIPLAIPAADGQVKAPKVQSNSLRLSVSRPLQVTTDGDAWKTRAPQSAGVSWEQVVLTSEAPQAELPLIITHQKSDEQLSNAIDRLWLQTWLTASERRDHAAMQVTTHENRFRVRLPTGVDPESLIVFVEGRRLASGSFSVAAPARAKPPELSIDLASVNSSPFHLEFWYGFVAPREPGWRMQLAGPEFLDVSWVRHAYWQVVLPPDEHLVATPRGFSAEHTWIRKGFWWSRQATLHQRDLEAWSGASQQPATDGANEYLFSTFGAPKRIETYTVHRTPAVLAWSGLVLILGLVLLRLPPRRQMRRVAQGSLIGALALIVSIALAPDAAVLAIQCAAAGVAGVALAWFMAWLGSSPPTRAAGTGGVSSALGRTPASVSTRSQPRPIPAAAQASSPHDSSL